MIAYQSKTSQYQTLQTNLILKYMTDYAKKKGSKEIEVRFKGASLSHLFR